MNGANEWQLIHSVPKDGTPVDLWHKNGFRIVDTWWVAEDECFTGVFATTDFTHWMLPPEPPK